ncbi:hypothetical protein B0H17DRAFT_978133 [Mycena rosella]|uniref:Uncharacterized protein n=1 Tax=Mycena rosella TaxID=1033263 RepID=A0AAD7DUI3_MYCRO|nr:hypothetical protein B0H17DRAFT_978133 [Mycena rosella]
MRSIALLILSFILVVLADQNTTIDDTDPSIKYSDSDPGHTPPCAFDADGHLLSGQPGCVNTGVKNCSSGAYGLLKQTSTLSMQFKGSAIYMNTLLNEGSNTYTVTLDGKSTDVDGVRPNGPLLCFTLFSQTELDPTADHNISLSIKGPSPTRNTTFGDGFSFWLDNFIITTPDVNSSSTSGTPSNSSAGTSPSPGASGALGQLATTSPWIYFGVITGSLFLAHLLDEVHVF